MYELMLDTEFCAAHAIVVGGVREPVHGHNWKVTLTVAGEELDDDGLLCDFHTVKGVLEEVCRGLDLTDLNENPALRGQNPSAEVVARHIGHAVRDGLGEELSAHARVTRVTVSESPGCRASWIADGNGRTAHGVES